MNVEWMNVLESEQIVPAAGRTLDSKWLRGVEWRPRDQLWWDLWDRLRGERFELRWAVIEVKEVLKCQLVSFLQASVQLTAASERESPAEPVHWHYKLFGKLGECFSPHSRGCRAKKHCCKKKFFVFNFLCQILSQIDSFQVARAVNVSALLHRVLSSQVTWRH